MHACKKIIDHIGGKVSIGVPLVEHKKVPRNTLIDLQKEIWGMVVSESLFNITESIELSSRNYFDAYHELIQNLS